MTSPPLAIRINQLHHHVPWGRSTTYRLVKDGRLPARRLGGVTVVLGSDLERFLHDLPMVTEVGDGESSDFEGAGVTDGYNLGVTR